MKYLVGYKLLTETKTGFKSWCYPKFTLEYPILVPVKRPKGWGPLAVFTSLEAAKAFDAFSPIFKCIYLKSRAKHCWRVVDKKTRHELSAVEGKDLADEVILVERVQ